MILLYGWPLDTPELMLDMFARGHTLVDGAVANGCTMLLANPLEHINALTIALLLAWILSVCLHEFAHALVAYIGGDDSVRREGYLSLDPTRFIDPFTTLLIPAVILLIGGFPLPGGSVPIDFTRLRSERWRRAVFAAGPAANFLLFLLILAVLHPRTGLVDHAAEQQPQWVYFLGALAVLQLFAVFLNLIPLPPLDGFGLVEHQFPPDVRMKMREPRTSFLCLALLYALLWMFPPIWGFFFRTLANVSTTLGVPVDVLLDGYRAAFFGGV
jgi:Zn-dependent protease